MVLQVPPPLSFAFTPTPSHVWALVHPWRSQTGAPYRIGVVSTPPRSQGPWVVALMVKVMLRGCSTMHGNDALERADVNRALSTARAVAAFPPCACVTCRPGMRREHNRLCHDVQGQKQATKDSTILPAGLTSNVSDSAGSADPLLGHSLFRRRKHVGPLFWCVSRRVASTFPIVAHAKFEGPSCPYIHT